MAEEKKDSKSKTIIILLIVIIVLLIGGGVTAFVLLSNGSQQQPASVTEGVSTPQQTAAPETTAADNKPKLAYEAGAIALDEDSLQKAYDEAVKKTEEGYISLDFFNEAYSTDGENFECRIGNAPENTSDMYCAIYLDSSFSQQVYLSGLIRPGEQIAKFKSNIKLETGTHEAILVLTQVMDDHETLKAETSVVLQLVVS